MDISSKTGHCSSITTVWVNLSYWGFFSGLLFSCLFFFISVFSFFLLSVKISARDRVSQLFQLLNPPTVFNGNSNIVTMWDIFMRCWKGANHCNLTCKICILKCQKVMTSFIICSILRQMLLGSSKQENGMGGARSKHDKDEICLENFSLKTWRDKAAARETQAWMAKVKLSLCLTKHHAMRTYCGVGGTIILKFILNVIWRCGLDSSGSGKVSVTSSFGTTYVICYFSCVVQRRSSLGVEVWNGGVKLTSDGCLQKIE
jgi:hypothetical protein